MNAPIGVRFADRITVDILSFRFVFSTYNNDTKIPNIGDSHFKTTVLIKHIHKLISTNATFTTLNVSYKKGLWEEMM
jgi:hypothetical protein